MFAKPNQPGPQRWAPREEGQRPAWYEVVDRGTHGSHMAQFLAAERARRDASQAAANGTPPSSSSASFFEGDN